MAPPPETTAQGNGAPRWVPVSKLAATPDGPRTPDPPPTSDTPPTPVQPVEQPTEVRPSPEAPRVAIAAGPSVEQPPAPEPAPAEPEPAPGTPEPVAATRGPPAEPEPAGRARARRGHPRPVAAVREPGPLPPTPDPSAPEAVPPTASSFLQRGRVRRRARYLRQLRELQLRDLGGFMVELQRRGRQRPDLVQAEARRGAPDRRGAARARPSPRDRPAAARTPRARHRGACGNCAALHGSRDKFCASCGEPVGAG